jgi:hypothetical protein
VAAALRVVARGGQPGVADRRAGRGDRGPGGHPAPVPAAGAWISYRSTAEALKHERYLYLARAGPYTGEDRHRQLAERIEGLISQEHAKWASSSQQPTERLQGSREPAPLAEALSWRFPRVVLDRADLDRRVRAYLSRAGPHSAS